MTDPYPLAGQGAPASTLGVDGDFYIDGNARTIYGPRASGAWPAAVPLSGADGTNAWTPTFGSEWTRSGGKFTKNATVGWSNAISSVERFAQARASGVVTSATECAMVAGLLNPATGDYWTIYAYGSDGSGPGTIQLAKNFATTLVDTNVPIAVGQVLEVAHVGTDIRAFINGLDVGALPGVTGISVSTPLKLYARAYSAAAVIENVTFAKGGTPGLGSFTLINHAGCSITGNSISKTGRNGAYDASVISLESYTAGAVVGFQPTRTDTDVLVGLSTNPTASDGYDTIDYAWYVQGSIAYPYHLGSTVSGSTSAAITDVFQVRYNNSQVSWIKNGVVIYSIAASSGLALYLDSSLFEPGSGARNITFGPCSPAVADSLGGGSPSTVFAPSQNAVVAGLASKVDHYPSAPYSSVASSYERIWNEWVDRWVDSTDAANPKLRPVFGITDFRTGTPADVLISGYIAGSTLTVANIVTSAGEILAGMLLYGPSVVPGTKISSGSGSTWTIDHPTTVGSAEHPTTFNAVPRTSPWQWAIQIATVYNRWQWCSDNGDAAGKSSAANLIASSWTAFKAQFSTSDMISTTYEPGGALATTAGTNKLWGLSDDAAWIMVALEKIHCVTSDASALGYLIEMIAAVQVVFRDVNQTTTNGLLISTGLSTPGYDTSSPIAFQYHKLGYLYAHAVDGYAIDATYGRVSHQAELGTAAAAHYVANLADSVFDADFSAAAATAAKNLKPQFAAYALNVWGWFHAKMQTPSVETQGSPPLYIPSSKATVPGLYYCDLDLSDVTDPKPYNANYGRPIRGVTTHAEYANLQMGVLSARLHSTTPGDTAFLAEFKRIMGSYTDPAGFGRTFNGVPITNCTRDPWGSGQAHFEYVRWLKQLTTVDDYSLFRAMILNTGKHILATASSGYLSPDWGGPEWNPVYRSYTWEQQDDLNWNGNFSGGTQGGRWQAATCANSMMVVQAAAMLIDYETKYGSGISNPVAIEQMPVELSSLKAAIARLYESPTEYRFAENAAIRYDPLQFGGDTKGFLTFHVNDRQVMYVHSSGSGFHGSLLVDTGGQIQLGNGNHYLGLNGSSDLYINFDVNQTLTFDSSHKRYLFGIDGVTRGYIDTTGFHNGAP